MRGTAPPVLLGWEIGAGAITYVLLAFLFMRADTTEALQLALGRSRKG